MSKSIIAVPDLHLPFDNERAVKAALAYIIAKKPWVVIQLGDLYDWYSFTSFDRTFKLMTPHDEVTAGRVKAEMFWGMIKKKCPKTKCIQLKGNHDDRPYKRLMKNCAELEPFFNVKDAYEFPGVETFHDSRDLFILPFNGKKIVFQHGHYSRPGQHLDFNKLCTVRAHLHTSWLHYSGNHGRPYLWEVCSGYLGDRNALPLSFTKQRQISTWTEAITDIDKDGPKIVTL